jgi:asparagine synthase (glutamine-hydrolysing)
MQSADGQWTLIYNGEVANYRDIRAAHRGPWRFRTRSDTEVVLATFAAEGYAAMRDWVGMFAFALYDRERERLHLVRDRFGIKPLYWVRLTDGGIAAASEIPPLIALQPSIEADEDTIRTYLETGEYDTGRDTFFAGVKAIEPGSAVQIDLRNGSVVETRWYDLSENLPDLSNASERELIARGAELIETAVHDHLVSDVRVGLNVSGGVDSSVLVRTSLSQVENLHVFTQDFDGPYSEAPWVRKVAVGTHLHLCRLRREDIEARLEWTVRRQAEPFGGVSVIAYDAIYRAARDEGVTVLLDGNGVDEAFLGYSKYTNGPTATGRSIDGTLGVRPDAVAARLRREAAIRRVRAPAFADPMKAEAARDLTTSKIPRGLRFNDRMSMGYSRELRVPFLDHRLVEFGFATPSLFLMTGGRTKALFRDIAKRWIPADVADAPKRSVQSPQREWLAADWHSVIMDLLRSDSFADRGWIDPQRAQELYEDYVHGRRENSFFVWQWLNLELWARAFLG